MNTMNLLENLEFHDENPYAQPLLVNEAGRILRFILKPGQSIQEHNVPHSPLYVVVVKGHGFFAGADGQEHQLGPYSLLVFDPGEVHLIRAVDEELVFVGFLHEAPGAKVGRPGGIMAKQGQG